MEARRLIKDLFEGIEQLVSNRLAETYPAGYDQMLRDREYIDREDESILEDHGMTIQPVVTSLTSTLIKFCTTHARRADYRHVKFWFNCHREHVFDEIPMELSWAGDHMKHEYGKSGLDPASVPEALMLMFAEFRHMIRFAESEGRVSWRDDRENHTTREGYFDTCERKELGMCDTCEDSKRCSKKED